MDVWDIIGIYRQENPADVSFGMIYESVHYSIQMAGFLGSPGAAQLRKHN
jgi:hypothetical protein